MVMKKMMNYRENSKEIVYRVRKVKQMKTKRRQHPLMIRLALFSPCTC